jgi:hypothetical protein
MRKLKYVQRQGSYHYFRRPHSERVRLNGKPGSTEYLDHYRRLLESTQPTAAAAPAPHAEPETKHIARLKRLVSKLNVPEDDRAFLHEAIDMLAEKQATERLMDGLVFGPKPNNERLVRLRKSGWTMDAMLGIEHYEVAGHHVTVKFDRERYKDRYIVTVPTLPDCHSAGHSVQDAINKIATVIGARKGKVSP